MPAPQEETEQEETQKDETGIRITRRQAVVGGLASGLLGALGANEGFVGRVVASSGLGINIDDQYDEGEDYRQYLDGNVDSFTIGDLTIDVDYPDMGDDRMFVECAIRREINGSYTDWDTYGEDDKAIGSGAGTVSFTTDDLWGGGTYDFEDVDDAIVNDDYENLSVDEMQSLDDPVYKDNHFELRFRAVSSEGNFSETEIIPFDLHIAKPLGFGWYFGKNFGKSRPSHWPEDWNW